MFGVLREKLFELRSLYKNNYALTHVFQLLCELVIFYWYVLHLLDFDTSDMVSFDYKCIFSGKSLVAELTHPHAYSAWSFKRKRIRAAELIAYYNYSFFTINSLLIFYHSRLATLASCEIGYGFKIFINTNITSFTIC